MLERDSRMDHMKCLLIFLVVFGHMLELFGGVEKQAVYSVIYSFHMPAFAFCSGYFARFQWQRILGRYLYGYLLYQLLYLLFARYVLQIALPLQWTTPYWLLWYLLAVAVWCCLLPLFSFAWNGKRTKGSGDGGSVIRLGAVLLSLAAAVAAALLVGYMEQIGYYFSLSRIFVFFPFFLLGYAAGQLKKRPLSFSGAGVHWFLQQKDKRRSRLAGGLLALVAAGFGSFYIAVHFDWQQNIWLYGAGSYAAGGYNLVIRLALMGLALNWIGLLYLSMPVRRLPVLAAIGQHSMAVYVLHGFVRKYLEARQFVFVYDQWTNLAYSALLTVLLLLLFGNPFVSRLLRFSWDLGAWPFLQKRS